MECFVAEPDRPVSLIQNKGWPSLNWGDWKDSYATLHRWTQIVGKIRMVNTRTASAVFRSTSISSRTSSSSAPATATSGRWRSNAVRWRIFMVN
jgi:hypothetical protein